MLLGIAIYPLRTPGPAEHFQMKWGQIYEVAVVLIFCVEFRELSHSTHDLSQAEKKITVFTI